MLSTQKEWKTFVLFKENRERKNGVYPFKTKTLYAERSSAFPGITKALPAFPIYPLSLKPQTYLYSAGLPELKPGGGSRKNLLGHHHFHAMVGRIIKVVQERG